MFGSLAWGLGAFIVGALIDSFGMDALFYISYLFYGLSLFLVIVGLPSHFTTVSFRDSASATSSSSRKDSSSSGLPPSNGSPLSVSQVAPNTSFTFAGYRESIAVGSVNFDFINERTQKRKGLRDGV